MIDDGTIDYGVASANFDGDGNPTKRNVVLEKGVLEQYLYDDFYGKKFGVESTGNQKEITNLFPPLVLLTSLSKAIK